MKLMTYNLLNGAIDQFDEVIKVINDIQPDFLTLNEANGFDKNNNQRLKEFAVRTKLLQCHLAICGDGDSYHVAVFSKTPFVSLKEINPMARAGILVIINSPIGEIAIVGTHLTPYTEDLRIKEANRIITALSTFKKAIIMGDLNSLSQEDGYKPSIINAFNDMQKKKFTKAGKLRFDVIRTFNKAGFADTARMLGKEKDITAPTLLNEFSAHLNMRLDYVLVSDAIKSNVQQYEVIKNDRTEKASDHYPVIIDLE
jgi:exodeoxyribonuclease III